MKKILSILIITIILISTQTSTATMAAIEINEKILTLNMSDTYTLKISDSKKVKWVSECEDIVTVSSKGILTPVSEGCVNVYGIVNKKKYKCRVTITSSDKDYLAYEDDNVKIIFKGLSKKWLCFDFINKTDNNYFIITSPFNVDGDIYSHYLVDSTFNKNVHNAYYYKPSIEANGSTGITNTDIKNFSGMFTICYADDKEKVCDAKFSIDFE